jgi:hypothetical protein
MFLLGERVHRLLTAVGERAMQVLIVGYRPAAPVLSRQCVGIGVPELP